MGHLITVNDRSPRVAASSYVADSAVLAGDVRVGERASVWFGSVLRSEVDTITIGAYCNIQDLTVVHSEPGSPVTLAERVTVGHRAVLHCCTIQDDVLIGMGAIILNDAVIGRGAVIAAGAVVTAGTRVPEMTIYAGVPAKQRDGSVPDVPRINVEAYVRLAAAYQDRSGATSDVDEQDLAQRPTPPVS